MFGIEKYSQEALIEVFGTPGPTIETINRWRQSWKYDRKLIEIPTFFSAVRLTKEADIDPLFYQLIMRDEVLAIVLYKPEHEVFMKLHT